MPWYVIRSDKCPASKPWAVVSKSSGNVKGCHESKASAHKQMALLYAKQSRGEIK